MIPNTHFHKRCMYIMVLTALCIALIGGVLHSPIDVLSGATPSHSAANEKLSGSYTVLISPSLQPSPQAQQQFYGSFVHRTGSLSDWTQTSIHLYVPSGNDALYTYAQRWADRLAQQHITVQVTSMNAVMLRSRLRIGKYETAIVPDSFLQYTDEIPALQFHMKSYEMR